MSSARLKILIDNRNQPRVKQILEEWNDSPWSGTCDKRRKAKYYECNIDWGQTADSDDWESIEIVSDVDEAIESATEYARQYHDGVIHVNIEWAYAKWIPGHWETDAGARFWVRGEWQNFQYVDIATLYVVKCVGKSTSTP